MIQPPWVNMPTSMPKWAFMIRRSVTEQTDPPSRRSSNQRTSCFRRHDGSQ